MSQRNKFKLDFTDDEVVGAIGETAALDRTAKRIVDWASRRPDVTLIVTADHDTGSLDVVESLGRGRLPRVEWGSKDHTREPVDLFAMGPGTDLLHGKTLDLRWIHAVVRSRLTGESLQPPSARGNKQK